MVLTSLISCVIVNINFVKKKKKKKRKKDDSQSSTSSLLFLILDELFNVMSRIHGTVFKNGEILDLTEFAKVENTLQDISSGNLPDFTRPTTTLPDRMRFPKR